jgi:hypothetical protein
MKTNHAWLSTVLTIALTLPMFGQSIHDKQTKADMSKHDMSSMMGEPTFEETTKGLHIKVWLMTQKKHKKMMKGKMGEMMMREENEGAMGGMEMNGMKDTSKGMSKATRKAMLAGTHHIMLEVRHAISEKRITNASVTVQIVSPSKKNSSVDLTTMMSRFAGGLTLKEKGEYKLTLSVHVGGITKTTHFQYVVK